MTAPALDRQRERDDMVARQIEARGVRTPRILAAMRAVPRHRFVPEAAEVAAYADRPLPIGHGVTISQPYIVALMTELLGVGEGSRVLEIGTGCGYQTAVLAQMGARVFSMEVIEVLSAQTQSRLQAMGVEATCRVGDGYDGWPDEAPFDGILITAAPPRVPPPLVEQLAVGGRMVVPVGPRGLQDLQVLSRTKDGVATRVLDAVRFVPMTGRAQGTAD